MPTSEGSSVDAAESRAQRSLARLPESVLAGLREAFADEVNERLPRLREAVRTADPELLREALRDVHTLGSSAYVVGEPAAARTARAAEVVLVEQGPPERFAELVGELDAQLTGWLR